MLANGARPGAVHHRPRRLVHRRHGLPDRAAHLGRRPGRRALRARRGRRGGRGPDRLCAGAPAGSSRLPGAGRRALLRQQRRPRRRAPARTPARPRVAVLDIDSHHGNGTQGVFWDARRRAVRLAPWRPGRLLSLVCRPRRRARRRPRRGLQPEPAAAARQRRRRLARRARHRPRRHPPLRRRRAGAQPRLRRLRARAAQLPRGHRGRLRPRRRADRRACACPPPSSRRAATTPSCSATCCSASSPPTPDDRPHPHLRLQRHRGRAGRGAGADLVRPARLPGRRPARQGGRRGARAGARGADRDGPVAAAQARADQPRARPTCSRRAAISTCRSRWPCSPRWTCCRARTWPVTPRSANSRSTARSTPVAGVLPAAMAASARDLGLICPAAQGGEAAWAGRIEVLAAARPARR